MSVMVAEQRGCSTSSAEMAEYMQRVREQPSELPVEEWSLFPLVYKNAVGNRRAAWRVITSVEQKETSKGDEQLVSNAREYVEKVEGELQKIRDGILALMDKKLVPSASTNETKVSYYKKKSDYYRYLAEFATGETKSKADEDARDAYAEATKIAENDSAVTHPVHLAMALSSVVAQKQIPRDQTVPQVQVIEKTFESLGTAPVCQSTQAEIVEAVEIEVPLPAESASLMCVTPRQISQLQIDDKMVDVPVVLVVQAPQVQVVVETVEIPRLRIVEKINETPESDTDAGKNPSAKVKSLITELISQLQREMLDACLTCDTKFKIANETCMKDNMFMVTVEVEKSKIIGETVQRMKPIIQEKISQVIKHNDFPQLQFLSQVVDMPVVGQQQASMIVAKTVEIPEIQTVWGTETSDTARIRQNDARQQHEQQHHNNQRQTWEKERERGERAEREKGR